MEASLATGFSERQIKYWVEDGTLLAINSARDPVQHAKREKNQDKKNLDRWRIVVRRTGREDEKYKAFLTLEELVEKASNVNTN